MRIVKGGVGGAPLHEYAGTNLAITARLDRAPALDDLEDKVWGRVRQARADAAAERQWRRAQVLATSLALVAGVALGGAEATALMRTQQPSASLTATTLAPSELLEGRG